MLSQPKNRKVAALLALVGAIVPFGGGIHKFYLGQPLWGVVYLGLSWETPLARIACVIEAIWYLFQEEEEFQRHFNAGGNGGESLPVKPSSSSKLNPQEVTAIADALRQLETLRQEGLISEYEFEQKRRQWLDRMA